MRAHVVRTKQRSLLTVAARQSKAPAELEDHFEARGNYLPDGATFEVTRPMGIDKDRHDHPVVWY